MTRRNPFFLTLPLTLSLCVGAAAQSKFEGGPQKGAQAVQLSGSALYSSKDNNQEALTLAYGYYLSPRLEVGPRLSFSSNTTPSTVFNVPTLGSVRHDQSTTSLTTLSGSLRYHFSGAKFAPFVGAGLGYLNGKVGDAAADSGVGIGSVGTDYFYKPQQSIIVELIVEAPFRSNVGGTTGQLSLGFRTFF